MTETEEFWEDTINETPYQSPEPVYSIAQFSENYQALQASKAVILCALRLAGKDAYTVREARQIIHDFQTMEVR